MARDLQSKLKSGLTISEYYPQAARELFTPAEARKEYARLRKIANRRLVSLGRKYPESSIYQQYGRGFAPGGSETDKRIYARLFDVARFVNSKMSSVTGQRAYVKRSIASLHESGYTFINEKNFYRWVRFVEEVRQHEEARGVEFQSEDIIDMFERVEEENADPDKVAEDFEYFLENEETDLPKAKPTERMTPEQVRKRQAGRPKEQPRKRGRLPASLGSTRKGGRRGYGGGRRRR